MQLELSPAAEADLDSIWFYGAGQWNVDQADRYQSKLLEMMLFLAEHPELTKDRAEIQVGYKSYAIGAHIVFFSEREDMLRVIRVLHQRMDFVRHLVN